MDLLHSLSHGFAAIASLPVLLAMLAGAALGIVVGVLPGVGPGVTIAVLLPFTYGMPPLAGISLLLGVYCGAFYGGAVTSILIRTPGEASSIMTMFDGYPMAKRGEAQRALSLAFMSAFLGGIASALLLGIAAKPLSQLAARFGAAESVMAIVLAALCVGRAYQRQFAAALMMMGLGFFLGTVGIDPSSNEQRYTLGAGALLSGIPLVPVAVGLFGMAQALVMVSSPPAAFDGSLTRAAGVSWRGFLEPFRYPRTLLKGLTLGSAIGVLPAVGAALSTSLSYFWAQRGATDRTPFGSGNPEGIVAAESANNSNSGGAMITVLTLGIPGDAITAIIMGVFVVHGIVPGPALFTERPEIINGVFAALLAINVVILAMLVASVKALARLAYVDARLLGLGILGLSFVGAYSAANSLYYVWVAAGFGVFGLICARANIPTIPLILGMVMGDTLEASLRQALGANDGSFAPFVTRPMSAAMLALAVVLLLWPLLARLRRAPIAAAIDSTDRSPTP
ncbi:MAG: tripartite tricarboxylate transporter permease [Burkholderiaceae bacterium]